jgi:hypothetical protein
LWFKSSGQEFVPNLRLQQSSWFFVNTVGIAHRLVNAEPDNQRQAAAASAATARTLKNRILPENPLNEGNL